ncbi:hypothetical protein PEBR_30356 [Penicillium brasilianum]|uniref:Uncharacterized protein n=1 Tax=Penicillium brasilianum TaxID=104259 RepID=A0A1S9RGJ6_PENBI|nr:hypothetical protein PEBR_30356 [Penicillium brasilianum]
MPLQILDGETPTPPTWGSLPLEIYVLSEWETPHPSHPTDPESPSDRRRRLIRQFLALGHEGRETYRARAESPPSVSEAQLTEILLLLRPEALRPFAGYTGCLDEGLWLRLSYEDEEAHESLWSTNEDLTYVGPNGVILDDKSIFGGLDLVAAVELFPERITNEGVNIELRETILRETLSELEEDTRSGEEEYSDEVKEMLARLRAPIIANPLLKYSRYHAACVVTHIFVEDEPALNGEGLLHVFFDDCGNIVRQWRVEDDGGEADFDGSWAEGIWKEFLINGMGEVGPAYREGGIRGPPYM